MLTVQDSRIVLVTLEGLENILKVGQQDVRKNGGVNPYSVLIEEAFGVLFVCVCVCTCLHVYLGYSTESHILHHHEVTCRQTCKVDSKS